MNRQAVRVKMQKRRARMQIDVASRGAVVKASEAIRPRVEQRNARRAALGASQIEVVDATQEFVAKLPERSAEHSEVRQKQRFELSADEPVRGRVSL